MGRLSSQTTVLTTVLLVIICVLTPFAAHAESFEDLTYLSEEYYPFTYREGSRAKGFSVDLLRRIWDELGVPQQPVEVLPWARAFERACICPKTVLFAVTRTPEREPLFRWAGPIHKVRFELFAKKSSRLYAQNFGSLAGYSIGTVRGDVANTILKQNCPKCFLDAVADMRQNVRKLMQDRLNMVAYEGYSWPGLIRRLGFDPDQFEPVFLIQEAPIYFAFNIQTDPELVERFQRALDKVKESESYRELEAAYLQ
ncbi:substrate-binding periplasmic protein [Pseudodesulfovibrio sp.]|uniref:substrate-binding periplasmic protein n=1 Tax=unclassified Pseudodesulfovibrio TaxID=2661612 RepID=UPI003B00167A